MEKKISKTYPKKVFIYTYESSIGDAQKYTDETQLRATASAKQSKQVHGITYVKEEVVTSLRERISELQAHLDYLSKFE
jgi:hypothetical protein